MGQDLFPSSNQLLKTFTTNTAPDEGSVFCAWHPPLRQEYHRLHETQV